jgi:hypothetical protein
MVRQVENFDGTISTMGVEALEDMEKGNRVLELLEQGLQYLDKAYDTIEENDSDVTLGHLNIVETSIKTAIKHVRAELETSCREIEV